MLLFSQETDFLNDPMFIEWRLLRTEESERFWNCFVSEHPEYAETLNNAIDKFNSLKLSGATLHEATARILFEQIRNKAHRQKVRKRMILYLSTAASIALLMISSVFLFNGRDEKGGDEIVSAELSDGIVVGQKYPSDDIRLISGKNEVEIGQDAVISVKDKQASVIVGDKSSKLALSEKVMNRLIVPAGKRSMLQLSDGTRIWLNSGTELGFYPDGTREITVKGEIYIEVAKTNGKPFYVNAPDFKVSVLGTKFNVSAYSDDDTHSVALVEGLVEIDAPGNETVRLAPDEMLSVSPGNVKKESVNAAEYTSWKDGVLIFNNTPVYEVLKVVGRYYNVDFKPQNAEQLYAGTCTGKLFLSDDIDELIAALSVLSTSRYYRENEIIYLKR
jgi:ferric-dicitrate binding protein FerR (iron transport regulator)